MTIKLRPEHERTVAKAIQSGAYQSPEDVIGRALEVLRSQEEWLDDHRNEISDKIERAFGQFERGEFFSSEESRANMSTRKTAWLTENR